MSVSRPEARHIQHGFQHVSVARWWRRRKRTHTRRGRRRTRRRMKRRRRRRRMERMRGRTRRVRTRWRRTRRGRGGGGGGLAPPHHGCVPAPVAVGHEAAAARVAAKHFGDALRPAEVRRRHPLARGAGAQRPALLALPRGVVRVRVVEAWRTTDLRLKAKRESSYRVLVSSAETRRFQHGLFLHRLAPPTGWSLASISRAWRVRSWRRAASPRGGGGGGGAEGMADRPMATEWGSGAASKRVAARASE